MPTKGSETKKTDLGDALAGLVHAGQGVRKAARSRAVELTKEALGTVGKVADALGDLEEGRGDNPGAPGGRENRRPVERYGCRTAMSRLTLPATTPPGVPQPFHDLT